MFKLEKWLYLSILLICVDWPYFTILQVLQNKIFNLHNFNLVYLSLCNTRVPKYKCTLLLIFNIKFKVILFWRNKIIKSVWHDDTWQAYAIVTNTCSTCYKFLILIFFKERFVQTGENPVSKIVLFEWLKFNIFYIFMNF